MQKTAFVILIFIFYFNQLVKCAPKIEADEENGSDSIQSKFFYICILTFLHILHFLL